jgi:hypothetical protein
MRRDIGALPLLLPDQSIHMMNLKQLVALIVPALHGAAFNSSVRTNVVRIN